MPDDRSNFLAEMSARRGGILAYAFCPVSLDVQDNGRYLRFEHACPSAPRAETAAREIDEIRAQLVCLAGVQWNDHHRALLLGGAWLNDEVYSETFRRQNLRLLQRTSFDASMRRANGVVKQRMRRLLEGNEFISSFFDAPLWEIASRPHWSLEELEEKREYIEDRMGASIPDDPTDPDKLRKYWEALVVPGAFFRTTAWPAANAMIFCLRRAQAIGDIFQYGTAYHAMLTTMCALHTYVGYDDMEVSPKVRTSAPLFEIRLLAEFWELFIRFVQNWFSRVRVMRESDAGIVRKASQLTRGPVGTGWEIITGGTRQGSVIQPVVLWSEYPELYPVRNNFMAYVDGDIRWFSCECWLHWQTAAKFRFRKGSGRERGRLRSCEYRERYAARPRPVLLV